MNSGHFWNFIPRINVIFAETVGPVEIVNVRFVVCPLDCRSFKGDKIVETSNAHSISLRSHQKFNLKGQPCALLVSDLMDFCALRVAWSFLATQVVSMTFFRFEIYLKSISWLKVLYFVNIQIPSAFN